MTVLLIAGKAFTA